MRVALLISGYLRSFKINIPNIKTKILDKFDKVDIYIHITKNESTEDKYTPGGFTGIELPKNIIESEKSINLNRITDNFFIYSEILQKSKEIHLVDSVWASVIYLLDCKYKLFENIPIFIYPFRSREGGLLNYDDKNIEPKHPDNWIIKKV